MLILSLNAHINNRNRMYTGSMIDIAQSLLCDHIVSCNVQTELKQTFVSPESSVSPFSSTAPVKPNIGSSNNNNEDVTYLKCS